MSKELGKRYQSARETLDDIHGLRTQPPVDIAPTVFASPPAPNASLVNYTSEDLQHLAYDRNQEGDYEAGEKYSTAAIEKDTKNLFAFQTRGFARSNKGKIPEAVSDFTTAIRLCPKWNFSKLGQLYYHRAYAEALGEQRDLACEDIRQALQYDPTNSKYQYFRSRVCDTE